MDESSFQALIAIVNRETAIIEANTRQYGELRWDPWTPACAALYAELERRGIIPPEIPAARVAETL